MALVNVSRKLCLTQELSTAIALNLLPGCWPQVFCQAAGARRHTHARFCSPLLLGFVYFAAFAAAQTHLMQQAKQHCAHTFPSWCSTTFTRVQACRHTSFPYVGRPPAHCHKQSQPPSALDPASTRHEEQYNTHSLRTARGTPKQDLTNTRQHIL